MYLLGLALFFHHLSYGLFAKYSGELCICVEIFRFNCKDVGFRKRATLSVVVIVGLGVGISLNSKPRSSSRKVSRGESNNQSKQGEEITLEEG